MPQVRLVVSLGLPDPDRLSTTTVWSLLAHLGLFIGVLIYQSLPSTAPTRSDDFFVTLAAPAPSGEGSATEAPSEPARETPKRAEPTPPPTPPAKTAVPVPVPVKTIPREPVTPPKPHHAASEDPASKETPSKGHEASGDVRDGGSPGGPSAGGTATGVGGTSFGEGDFRYAWYQNRIEAMLQSAWHSKPISSSTEVQTTIVSFTIHRDGSVHDIQISRPSENSALDLSVIRAVYDANPLPELPRAWSGVSVHVSMEFRLNPGGP